MEMKMLKTINVIKTFELKAKMFTGVPKQISSWVLFIPLLGLINIVLKSAQRSLNYLLFLGDSN